VGTGTWTLISGAGTVTLPNSESSGVTGLGVGANTFQWTITNLTCAASSDQVTITRDDAPTVANAGADQSVGSTSATLAGNTPTVGYGKWTLISGAGAITTDTSPTSGVTGLGAGANTFRWSITNLTCAASTDDVVITRHVVAGSVEVQAFVGSSRLVRFIASQVDGGTTNYLQTNDVTLSFSGGLAAYSNSVPPLTTHVSAKTSWNLRKNLPVTFTGGVATVDFTGSGSRLRTGDLQATGGGIEDTDNAVLLSDLDIVLGYWNNSVGAVPAADRADIDGDGTVVLNDLDLVLGNWAASGEPE
jgi:hypothetical protein